jgi:hypothetical protein
MQSLQKTQNKLPPECLRPLVTLALQIHLIPDYTPPNPQKQLHISQKIKVRWCVKLFQLTELAKPDIMDN